MKALIPVKAAPMAEDELEAWFEGRTPRRILSIPFGGPIPSAKSERGVDLDAEWFSERTDIYGEYPELRQSRERFVDFHHSFVPPGPGYGDHTGVMKGVLLGKSVLDDEPDEDGWWSDVWLKAGEKRLNLVRSIIAKGGLLFGSSQPVGRTSKNPDTGEIIRWPHFLQTLTTAPQNPFSVLVPAKARLEALDSAEITVSPAVAALLADLDALGTDLHSTSAAIESASKAGLDVAYAATSKALDLVDEAWR